MYKKIKKIMAVMSTFAFIIIMCSGVSVKASSASSLTSLSITSLAVDDNNELHVVTKEIGTSSSSFVYCNGSFCKENVNERQVLYGSNNIAYGYIKYYHTGLYYTSSLSGTILSVKANATNARSPWNTLSTSTTFVLP